MKNVIVKHKNRKTESLFLPENWNRCFCIHDNQIFNLLTKFLPILTCILKSVKRKQKKNMKQIIQKWTRLFTFIYLVYVQPLAVQMFSLDILFICLNSNIFEIFQVYERKSSLLFSCYKSKAFLILFTVLRKRMLL